MILAAALARKMLDLPFAAKSITMNLTTVRASADFRVNVRLWWNTFRKRVALAGIVKIPISKYFALAFAQ